MNNIFSQTCVIIGHIAIIGGEKMELTEIKEKTLQALNELLEQANLKKDDIFVLP